MCQLRDVGMEYEVDKFKNQQQSEYTQEPNPFFIDDDAIAQEYENYNKANHTNGHDSILNVDPAFFLCDSL